MLLSVKYCFIQRWHTCYCQYFVNIVFTSRETNLTLSDRYLTKNAVFQGVVLVLSLEFENTSIYGYQSWCQLVNDKCVTFSISQC